jgi:NitT/TauT family transport system substrate-binding protein
MIIGDRDFVRRRPVATKQVLRGILKAASVCELGPNRATKLLAANGYVDTEGYARQALQEPPFTKWREYSSADSAHFNALRIHEAGFLNSSPRKTTARGTDWRLFNELKKELKG